MRVVGRGGAVGEPAVARPVTGIASLTRGAETPDDEAAAALTREGHRSPTCPDRVLPLTVRAASASRPA